MKRILTAAALAAAVTVATPGAASAVVSNTPEPVSPNFDGAVVAMARKGTTVYVAGRFNTARDADGSDSYRRNGVAAFDASTGDILPWNPRVDGTVLDLMAAKDGVYLVGSFTRVKRADRKNFAVVGRGGRAKVLPGSHRIKGGPVRAVTATKTRVYIGGDFRRVDGKARGKLAAFRRSGSRALTGWSPRAVNGSVEDLVKRRAGIYVAGEFRTLNGKDSDQRLALVNKRSGATISSFAPRVNRHVLDIAVKGSRVYVALGGLSGGGAMAVERSDGSTAWSRRLDGDVEAVAVMGGETYIGGHFTAVCDTDDQNPDGGACTGGQQNRQKGASLDAGSGNVTGWNPGANSDEGILEFDTVPASELLRVGGAFTTVQHGATNEFRLATYDAI